MFPIPWNFPFRKKNGDMSTIGAEIGGAGSELPPHGSSDAGKLLGVKPNGSLEWSDTVNSEIQTLTNNLNDEVATRVELGAHQLLKYTLESLKANNTSGTWNDNAYTINGVTFTLNDDLTITATGTASAQIELVVHSVGAYDVFLKANTSYIASIYDGKGSNSTFKLITYGRNASAQTTFDIISLDCDGQEINNAQASVGIQFTIRIMSGFNTNGIIFKPLLKFGADVSNEFTPYVMTNRELTALFASNASPLANFNANSFAVNGLKFLYFNNPKSAMTLNVDYACGTLPTKYRPTSRTALSVVANGRNYKIDMQTNGTVTITNTGGDELPSDGKPGIQYTVAYV